MEVLLLGQYENSTRRFHFRVTPATAITRTVLPEAMARPATGARAGHGGSEPPVPAAFGP
jgi:hypothetical protein